MKRTARSMACGALGLVLALLVPIHSRAQSCRDRATWLDCFTTVAAPQLAKEKIEKTVTPGEAPQSAGSLADFLPRIVTGLGIGELSEGDGSQTLKINLSRSPGEVQSPNQTILEVTRRDAEPLEALVNAIPESIRAARKTTLEGEVGDFDDVEASISVNIEKHTRIWRLGRSFGAYEDLTNQLFSAITEQSTSDPASMQELLALFERIRGDGNEDVDFTISGDVRKAFAKNPGLAATLEDAVIAAAVERARSDEAFKGRLRSQGYFGFADLVHNQPQLHFDGLYRWREDSVGPDEWNLKATYEHGFGNVNSLIRSCDNDFDLDCYQEFRQMKRGRIKSANRLAISLEYGEASDVLFALPDDNFTFAIDEVQKTLVSGSYGRSLTVDKEGTDTSRLDVEVSYQDVTGDPIRNERLVATATFSQNIFTGDVVSLTLIYADKPEYRGEVDEEFSARAGLKFKVDKK